MNNDYSKAFIIEKLQEIKVDKDLLIKGNIKAVSNIANNWSAVEGKGYKFKARSISGGTVLLKRIK